MVRAILEGRKTMTRRILKPQPEGAEYWTQFEDRGFYPNRINANPSHLICPYGVPGDHLWVRETWWCDNPATAQDIMSRNEGLYYKATEEHPEIFPRWRPSIHMPRWASRITLEVTGVKVERLQEISESDASKEGLEPYGDKYWSAPGSENFHTNARNAFIQLWESIYRSDSWKLNLWIWAISFKCI